MGLISDFLNLFYPQVCEACGNALVKNERFLCTKCIVELPYTHYHKIEDNPIEQLFWGRVIVENATALFRFQKKSKYQKLIHKLKYQGRKEIGFELGKYMGAEINLSKRFNNIDFIVPVPLHKKRYKERGYNQSEWIAKGISEITKIPISTDNFIRSVATETQTKKSKFERWKNVQSIFQIENKVEFESKHLLIIDDVVTTGATLESCADKLLEIDGVKISIAVIAVA